jgi:hypothetical protein
MLDANEPFASPPAKKLPPHGANARSDLLAIFVAVVGGAMGIVGAALQEVQAGLGILLVIVAAPVIEEALKPSGIFVLLVRWPHALRGQLHIATLAALSGVSFGLIESLIYVTVYVSDPSDGYVCFASRSRL